MPYKWRGRRCCRWLRLAALGHFMLGRHPLFSRRPPHLPRRLCVGFEPADFARDERVPARTREELCLQRLARAPEQHAQHREALRPEQHRAVEIDKGERHAPRKREGARARQGAKHEQRLGRGRADERVAHGLRGTAQQRAPQLQPHLARRRILTQKQRVSVSVKKRSPQLRDHSSRLVSSTGPTMKHAFAKGVDTQRGKRQPRSPLRRGREAQSWRTRLLELRLNRGNRGFCGARAPEHRRNVCVRARPDVQDLQRRAGSGGAITCARPNDLERGRLP
eukprot:6181971-Pleurochrysis_carterae.AAC.2